MKENKCNCKPMTKVRKPITIILSLAGEPINIDGSQSIRHDDEGKENPIFIPINPCNLEGLIDRGILMRTNMKPEDASAMFFIKRLADRLKWNINNVSKYLENLGSIGEHHVANIILREIAIYLDENYSDNIRHSKEIWVVSNVTGQVGKLIQGDVAFNFKNFAAFRSKAEVLFAVKLLKHITGFEYGK